MHKEDCQMFYFLENKGYLLSHLQGEKRINPAGPILIDKYLFVQQNKNCVIKFALLNWNQYDYEFNMIFLGKKSERTSI